MLVFTHNMPKGQQEIAMLELVLPNSILSEHQEFSLDEIAREGAKRLLVKALAAEVEEYLGRFKNERDTSGKRLVVKNGKSKERTILTATGELTIETPRVNDRREGKRFTSKILPPYLRKSPNIESVLPVLYLKGLSANSFSDALEELFGGQVKGLSKSTIHSLKKSWEKDLDIWRNSVIEDQFIYLWADGVHVKVRLGEDKKLCLLVVIGVNQNGEKKLLAVHSGYRESKTSWMEVFRDLEKRGLKKPLCIIGDGALGLWSCTGELELFRDTREQRCWVHKISNVLNKLPKRTQARAKALLHDMMMAETESDALKSKKEFESEFHEKFPKAVDCISKDWDALTTHFNFPAMHWQHIRTTNPIESMFATVKLRTKTSKGAGSIKTAETMAFKLMKEAEKKWRKIRGHEEIENLLSGGVYKDGRLLEVKSTDQQVVA